MSKQTLFLVIALVAISASSYSAFEFTSLAEVQNLRTSKYASNLIETISLSLNNKGSIKEIQELLDQLIRELDEDQAKATATWKKLDAELAKKIAELKQRIKDLTEKIELYREKIVYYQNKITLSKRNLKQYNSQKDKNDESIKQVKAKRKEDKENFIKSQSEHTDVINVVDKVVAKLSELIGSVSGVGKYSHIKSTAAEKRDLNEQFLQIANGNQEEANILLELSTSANQKTLKKLIDLLNKIKKNTQKSLADDVAAEEKSKETAITLLASLHKDNQRLTQMIARQEEKLKKYEGKLSEFKTKLAKAIEARKIARTQLKLTIKQRAEAKAAYEKEKKERAEDKAVVIKLRTIFMKKVANMSNILKKKTKGF